MIVIISWTRRLPCATMRKTSGENCRELKSAIPFRFRQSQRFSQPRSDPGDRKAREREVRICADPARRHLQGNQQQVARRNARRRQEQARISRAGNRTLPEALWRQALCLESILPGQHTEPDARGGGGPVRRRVRKICRGRLSSHVGRAEEDG